MSGEYNSSAKAAVTNQPRVPLAGARPVLFDCRVNTSDLTSAESLGDGIKTRFIASRETWLTPPGSASSRRVKGLPDEIAERRRDAVVF
jgi:hypothetical protein